MTCKVHCIAAFALNWQVRLPRFGTAHSVSTKRSLKLRKNIAVAMDCGARIA
jgi:hypothetical protein